MLVGIPIENYTKEEQLSAAKKILFGKSKSKKREINQEKIKITDDLLRNAISENRYKKSDFVRYAGKNMLSKQILLRWLSKDGVAMDTITNPYNSDELIDPQTIIDYILDNPSNKRKGYLNGINDLNEVNKKFNELVLTKKTTLKKFVFGYPTKLFLDAGFENLPIELLVKKLYDKSKQKNHIYDLQLLKDLVKNFFNPKMIFKSSTVKDTFLVMVDNKQGENNFVVVVKNLKDKIEINSILSIYPRAKSQIESAIRGGYLLYERKKTTDISSKQPLNATDLTQPVSGSATKVKKKKKTAKKRTVKTQPTLYGLENITKIEPKEIIDLSPSGELGQFLTGYEPSEYAVIIKGDKGAGKSRLLHQLMNLFAGMSKKIAFLSLEMDKSTAIAQQLVKEYISGKNQSNILCTSQIPTIEELSKIASSGQFEVIAIDSFNKIKDFNQKNFEELRKKYPKIIWLVIFQSTTGKVIRGGNMPEYDCSVVIQINTGGNAVLEKNRYGETNKIYNVFTQKINNYGNNQENNAENNA